MSDELEKDPQNPRQGAMKLVEDAAAILQEELSSGVEAARRVQKRLFTDEVRAQDTHELLDRLRKDVHDAVDVAVEALAGALNTLGASRSEGREPASTVVPTVPSTGPVAPGSRLRTRVEVANGSDAATEPFALKA